MWFWYMRSSETTTLGISRYHLCEIQKGCNHLKCEEAKSLKTLRKRGMRSMVVWSKTWWPSEHTWDSAEIEGNIVAHFMDVGIGTQSSWMPVFWPERHLLINAVTEHNQSTTCGKSFWHMSFSNMLQKQCHYPPTRVKHFRSLCNQFLELANQIDCGRKV